MHPVPGSLGDSDIELDHACRMHRWQIVLRAEDDALLGELATDDTDLWSLLADRLLGAVTAQGTVTRAELCQDGAVVERRLFVRVARPAPRPPKTRP
ncbi:MAG TPA: hypothetical protein VGM10_25055 [Actinocrinis sp.]|jgi:hypothetical protein